MSFLRARRPDRCDDGALKPEAFCKHLTNDIVALRTDLQRGRRVRRREKRPSQGASGGGAWLRAPGAWARSREFYFRCDAPNLKLETKM